MLMRVIDRWGFDRGRWGVGLEILWTFSGHTLVEGRGV
jgi:hypothetical protein